MMVERSSARPDNVPAFDLRIDELVLHGFRPADRYRIAAAIERELSRLFGEGGVPAGLISRGAAQGGWSTFQLDAGSFDVPHDATAEDIGLRVARAIHRGIVGDRSAVGQPAQLSASRSPGPGGVGR